MSNLNELNFNASEVKPNSFDVLPAGEYDAVIVKSEVKPTSTGGRMLKLQLQILNGEYQNRTLFDNLNLWNSNEKAVQIARGTLSAICRAVDVLTPKDSSELHGKSLRIKVAVTNSADYGEQNQIKAYKPRQTGPAPAPAGYVETNDHTPVSAAGNGQKPW